MKDAKTLYYNKLNEPLKKYKTFTNTSKTNPQAFILLGLFVLATIVYALELFQVLTTSIFTPSFYAVITFVALIGPLIYVWRKKQDIIIFAEHAMMSKKAGKKWQIVPFETIKKVLTDHENTIVLIGEDDTRMEFDTTLFDNDFKVLQDVLNYRGFYKDGPQNYELHFDNNTVSVEVIEEAMDEDTSHLFEKFIKKYTYLTPGFLEDLIFYNIQIERIQLTEGKHLVFHLSHLDVKPTHPENTSFKAQKTDEAMIIFENVAQVSIHTQDKTEKDQPELTENTLLGETIQMLRETTKNAVIFEADSEVKQGESTIVFVMSHASKKQRVRFSFTQIIAGWNTFKALSWFEK